MRLAWMKEWRSKLSWSTNYRSGCVYGFRHPANNFREADTRVLVRVGILAIIKSASMRKQTCACAAALRVFSDQPHAVKPADSRVEVAVKSQSKAACLAAIRKSEKPQVDRLHNAKDAATACSPSSTSLRQQWAGC